MSNARHHLEWMSLVPVVGPFLSLPVLLKTFPQGLDAHQSALGKSLRRRHREWEEAKVTDTATHRTWVRWVLEEALEHQADLIQEGDSIGKELQLPMPQHGELLKPDYAVIDPDSKKARLLISVYPRSQKLDSYVTDAGWKASPETRLAQLLRAARVRLGLATNGEDWVLVHSPEEGTTGFSYWAATHWEQEELTFRAFRSLLRTRRFFGVPDEQTIEALFKESQDNQQDVTDQLGYQVRRAVEVLIASLDRADKDHQRQLLADIPETVLYEASLTLMMRLVFLFCAEERGLIPTLSFPVYEQNYAVSSISNQLRELADQHGEELLERRFDAWPRLLAAFRIVYGGIRHDDLHMPGYGGSLFDPDRFPFLEGRQKGSSWKTEPAQPLPVDNRTVLHLLEAMQVLRVRIKGGGPAEARRLSFRALDIEQIGYVYEGLLDHTAKRATEPVLGLEGTRENEPEVTVSKLVELRSQSIDALVEHIKERTGKSPDSIKRIIEKQPDPDRLAQIQTACGETTGLFEKVKPFVSLIRDDSFHRPVVIHAGSVYVTAGTDRRSSGTHYTPRQLTEPIVKYTLEPLVFTGPAEGKPEKEWVLKSPKEILDLKVCDMACGSGAFLVQTARYLCEQLLEAWGKAEKKNPGSNCVLPYGDKESNKPGELLLPKDPAERKIAALRLIAQHCLYGVDINPLAVEMAKLSLWLLTLAKEKPFEFLDHAIRWGDSLVGLHTIDQLRHYSLKPDAHDAVLFKGPLDSAVDEAMNLRLKLEDMPANTVEDVQWQEKLLAEANEMMVRLRCAADLLVAAEYWGETAKDKLDRVTAAAVKSSYCIEKGSTEDFELIAAKERRGQKMFHWPLEFPEVIVRRKGFDAFVGNPPFMGTKYWGSNLGPEFVRFSQKLLDAPPAKCDLSAVFLKRAFHLLNHHGHLGLILTSSINSGDNSKLALVPICNEGMIYRAFCDLKWPGVASVVVSLLWASRFSSKITSFLNNEPKLKIDCLLTESSGPPKQLENGIWGAYGSDNGNGEPLVIYNDDKWITDLEDSPYLRRYVNAEDLNTHGFRKCDKFIIDVLDASIEDVFVRHRNTHRFLTEKVRPERLPLLIGSYASLAKSWWQIWRCRKTLYERIRKGKTCVVVPIVSKYVLAVTAPSDWTFTNRFCVLEDNNGREVSIISSFVGLNWVPAYSGRLGETYTVSLTQAIQTLPLPVSLSSNAFEVGKKIETCRNGIVNSDKIGMTDIYNHLHDPCCSSKAIEELRFLQIALDKEVAASYGWDNLQLGHDFHETKQGIRFTISESARRDVLQRLLKLNHERYAEEVKQGLHGKKGTKASSSGTGTKARRGRQKAGEEVGQTGDGNSLFSASPPAGEPEEPDGGGESSVRVSAPVPIEARETDEVMAAFRQASRRRGWMERLELLKAASLCLGFQRMRQKTEEVLRNHLRTAIRRKIIETDGPDMVRGGTDTLADYSLEDLRDMFKHVMKKSWEYQREEIINGLSRYLGFSRTTDTSREAIRSAINSGIRQGVLEYRGDWVWRTQD